MTATASRYQATAREAYASVRAAGSRVTFVSRVDVPGGYDDRTARRQSPVTVAVPGYAVRVKGDPLQYQALGLVQSEAPTLLFAPDTFGRLPAIGAIVQFGGASFTVRAVDAVAPDGVAIIAKIVIVGGGLELVLGTVTLELPLLELTGAMALLFRGTADLALPALHLDASGHNGVLFAYLAGGSLAGATFTRNSTATYVAEV